MAESGPSGYHPLSTALDDVTFLDHSVSFNETCETSGSEVVAV